MLRVVVLCEQRQRIALGAPSHTLALTHTHTTLTLVGVVWIGCFFFFFFFFGSGTHRTNQTRKLSRLTCLNMQTLLLMTNTSTDVQWFSRPSGFWAHWEQPFGARTLQSWTLNYSAGYNIQFSCIGIVRTSTSIMRLWIVYCLLCTVRKKKYRSIIIPLYYASTLSDMSY